MREIKLTIDGKEFQLTEEQVKMLGFERTNPFEKVDGGGSYYFINNYANINEDSRDDDLLLNTVNYFNDKAFANQVALNQLLYRKLLKFSYDNRFEDTVWNNKNNHWYIYYNYVADCFDCQCNDSFKSQSVYFSSQGAANRAICEVVMPFVKEHPEFVW